MPIEQACDPSPAPRETSQLTQLAVVDAYHLAHTLFPRLVEYLGSTISFPFVSIQDGFDLYDVESGVLPHIAPASQISSLSFVQDEGAFTSRTALAFVAALKSPEYGEALLQLPECARTLKYTSVSVQDPAEAPSPLATFYKATGSDSVVHVDVVHDPHFWSSTASEKPVHVIIVSLLTVDVDLQGFFAGADRMLQPGGFLLVTGAAAEWQARSEGNAINLLKAIALECKFELRGPIQTGNVLTASSSAEQDVLAAVKGQSMEVCYGPAEWFGAIFRKPRLPQPRRMKKGASDGS